MKVTLQMAHSISKWTDWTRFIVGFLVNWWQTKILKKLQLFQEPPQIKFDLIAFQLHVSQAMVCASGFEWSEVGNPHYITWLCRIGISVAFLTAFSIKNILLKATDCFIINIVTCDM
jgi:hypothetical protein